MSIVILSNHSAVFPSLHYFHTQNILKAVVSVDYSTAAETIFQMEDFCRSRSIEFIKINKSHLETRLSALFNRLQPDMAIMCGFPYRIPETVFSYPSLGFYNIHFSLLPAYKGPNPIFWQLKNGETTGGITIHEVDKQFDSGPIVMQQEIPFIPGENWGFCNSRYGNVACNMLVQLVNKLTPGEQPDKIIANNSKASYYGKPAVDDLTINWEINSAAQIENLVNACNPFAGGAITFLRQQPVRILEVSPVDGLGDKAIAAGTIIHADGNGLFVQCINGGLLRVNIISMNEGIITGHKLAAWGVQRGNCFEHAAVSHQVIETN